ncbi:MAG: hypothetical protein GC168_21560 [Candidatus Hydrogenedens sp.]|nr:hypothetical protein [Candidatus Hydrogenedens sp.]
MKRMKWLAACALSATVAFSASAERVVILGFDGGDPHLAKEMMDAGDLPNLAKLRDQGSFQPLGSTNPPQSPTAWSSFNTCRTPLNHGIYDFLRRTPATHMPGVGFGSTTKAKLGPDGALLSAPEYVSNRKGDNFWKIASDQGKKVTALVVPFAFPADDLGQECYQLCGLDVPDIRGTSSTYFALSEEFDAETPVAGGVRLPLKFTDGKASVQVPGLADPRERGKYVTAPLGVAVDRAAKTVTIIPQIGEPSTVAEGDWSAWQEWSFEVTDKYKVAAISRFHVMSAGDSVRLYMTCLQFDPADPMIPITAPADYGKKIKSTYGNFKTIGWEYDTKALQQDDMTEEMFIQDVYQTLDWQEQFWLDEFDRGGFDLFLAATTGTDRLSHMFWAYRDPKHPLYTPEKAAKYGKVVNDIYKRMDEIVGQFMSRLKEDDLLMVMSDHGFHSFRTEFDVNKWLIDNGYLAVKGGGTTTDARFLQGFDWSKTQAYGLGLGMIFINMKGREGQGIVDPADAPALIEEIRGKLLEVTNPENGEKVFRAVYPYINPQGEATEDTPDIQLGYDEGYQTAKTSAAGGTSGTLFSPNMDKWSGEHASSDIAFTQGIFFASKPVNDGADLIDLGVTAFDYLGLEKPAVFEGESLLKK